MMKKISLLFALCLTACATQTVNTEMSPTISDSFRYLPQGEKSDLGEWYQAWQDPVLSDLIQKGVRQNFSVQAALKRVSAANQYAQTAKADLLPKAGVSGNLGYQNASIDNPLNDNPFLSPFMPEKIKVDDGLFALGFSASWEPDIFGKKTADADSVAFQALSAREQTEYLQQAIAAKIAVLYCQIVANDKTLHLIDENIKTIKELQRYAQGRFNAGQAQRADILETQMAVEKLTAQKTALTTQRAEQEQQLAVLTGQNPQTFRLADNPNALPQTPTPPTGFVPSDILELRPDIRSKALSVKAAAAKVASAKADLLPRFYLQFLGETGKIGISSDGVGFQAALFNAGVELPIFTAGRIKHNISAKEAELEAAMADYQQEVLNALQEVDTAYHTRILLDKRSQQLNTAQKTAQKRQTAQKRLFDNGYAQYNEVLRAKLDELALQQEQITANRDRNLSTIALYRALGGKPLNNEQ
ncbi:MAG: TolC family protein [Neisseriaceae bacterium]|nr:TolC family protein [Neisseriaceae bacterium]